MTPLIPVNQIGTVIINNVILDLSAEFANAPPNEVAGVIKEGRLQSDPELAHISLTVHVSDPDNPDKWQDSVFADRDNALDRSQFEAYTWEVGSRGSLWWRRGSVQWEFFGTKTGDLQPEAQRKAGVIEGRIQRAIDHGVHVIGAVDDFGELVINIMTTLTRKTEGGGPPNQYIWRGTVLFQAFTARS